MRRSRLAHRRAALLPLAAATLGGCAADTTTAPRDANASRAAVVPATLEIRGADVADTIDAPLAAPLVVRDSLGRPRPTTYVHLTPTSRLRPAFVDRPAFTVRSARILELTRDDDPDHVVRRTGADGTLRVGVALGPLDGPAAVVVAVPEIGLVDTARFTVRPGGAVRVVLPTRDTAVTVGDTLAVPYVVVDRQENAVAGAPTFASSDPAVVVSPGGAVRATTPARAAIRVAVPGVPADSLMVSAVPDALIAVRTDVSLADATSHRVLRLDGRLVRLLRTTRFGRDPEWTPDGAALLAALGTTDGMRTGRPEDVPHLYRIGADGTPVQVVGPAAYVEGRGGSVHGVLHGFTPSRDGAWYVVSMRDCDANRILYRVWADPADPARAPRRLTPDNPPIGKVDCGTSQGWPTAAPDGARIAFENDSTPAPTIELMSLATGAVTRLGVSGQRPRWSPTGELVAFNADERIWAVRPDGTGRRPVTPASSAYLPGVAWSPDGRWLLARRDQPFGLGASGLVLIDVATGEEILLAHLGAYGAALPAWRP